MKKTSFNIELRNKGEIQKFIALTKNPYISVKIESLETRESLEILIFVKHGIFVSHVTFCLFFFNL